MSDTSKQQDKEAVDLQINQVLHACEQGNIEQVRLLIREQKCNPCVRTIDEATALHIACERGHIDIVCYFIDELNCDPEVRNKNQSTPLHFACAHGKFNIVCYLVGEKGCNIDVRGNHQATPVHYACQQGHINIVRYLVKKGCDLDARADRNMSPLHAACYSGKIDIVRYLIHEKNCDFESKGTNESTPIYYACEMGQINIVKYLVELGCNPNARIDTDAIPLHIACASGHLNVVRYLVGEQKCDPWMRNKIDETPMQVAIAKGQIEVLKYFVKEFGMNECNFYLSLSFTVTLDSKISKSIEATALHVACTHGHLHIVKYLVEELKMNPGQKCCIECGTASTPLSCACSTGRLDIVQYLLLHTTVYRKSKLTGELGGACYGCHANVVEYLIHNYNVDLNNDSDYYKHSLLQLAISGGSEIEHNSSIQLVTSGGSLNDSEREQQSKTLKVLEILVSCGIDLNKSNYLGDTALHTACKLEQPVFVELLLSKKCDPTLLNKAGKTPLWTTKNADVFKVFMQYTPTEVCERILSDDIEEKHSLELLKCLIWQYKWDPNEKTSNEDTALHLACKSDKVTIVKYLLSQDGIICDPCAKNGCNETPFELTSSINIIRELIKCVSNPIVLLTNRLADEEKILELVKEIDKDILKSNTANGNTALHLACLTDREIVVKYLLRETDIDVNAVNESNIVPIQLTKKSEIIRELIQYGANPTDLYNYCRRVLRENKLLQTAVKVFMLGDISVGKSTLVASLDNKRWLGMSQSIPTSGYNAGSGVTANDFNGKHCGRGTLYDFVGERQLHESQSELLEKTSSAPRVFIVVINLNDKDSNIISSLQYWLKFIERMPSSDHDHTIVIGSKLDLCECDMSEKLSILQERVDELSDVKCRDFMALDCRNHSSSDMTKLKRSLVKVCNIARNPDALAFNAHCFQVYIVDQFKDHDAVTFHDILHKIERDENHVQENDPLFFIPQTKFQLKKLCNELHNKSQVVFLQEMDTESSWIVINKSPLISGLMKVFRNKDLYQIPSNNGVLQVNTIAHLKPFKKYDSKMIIRLFSHLEYCKQLSDQKTEKSFSESWYLFPALVDNNAPESVWKQSDDSEYRYYCGWILHCIRQEQSFTSKFLQAVILRLMFSKMPPSTDPRDFYTSNKEHCTVWKGGLCQGYSCGTEILIHTYSDNKAVMLIIRHHWRDTDLANCIEVQSKAISMIRECAQELCPDIKTGESFINPTEIKIYPVNKTPPELHAYMFDTYKLAQAAVNTGLKPIHVSSLTGINPTSPRKLLHFEPYIDLPFSIIQELCNKNNPRYTGQLTDYFLLRFARQRRNSTILNEIINIIQKENGISQTSYSAPDDLIPFYKLKEWTERDKVTYQRLHKILDRFSVFSGLDLLVSS